MTVVLCSLTNIASRSLVAPDKVLWKRWEGRGALQAAFQQQLCTNGMGVWEATPGLVRQFSNAVNVCSYLLFFNSLTFVWPSPSPKRSWMGRGNSSQAVPRILLLLVKHVALPQGKRLRQVMRWWIFFLARKLFGLGSYFTIPSLTSHGSKCH